METLDHKKIYKNLYNPGKEPVLTEVPELTYIMIDGYGDPNTSKDFQEAVEALFSVSYALKFDVKKTRKVDYKVMPLEGLWWAADEKVFLEGDKSKWNWTLMILQPDVVSNADFVKALNDVKIKKPQLSVQKLRWESLEEGEVVQLMHIGPFSEEGPKIQKLHEYAYSHGYRLHMKHHEIYLSDFRKTAPEKLKTIIRQPVEKKK